MGALAQAVMMAGVLGAPAAVDAIALQQRACRVHMDAIAPAEPRLKQLEQVYDRHVHIGASVHNILPHYLADYDDLVRAKQALRVTDLPYIVFQIVTGSLSSKHRLVAIGVVPLFEAAALPCIEAALERRSAASVTLRQIKSIIEINQK